MQKIGAFMQVPGPRGKRCFSENYLKQDFTRCASPGPCAFVPPKYMSLLHLSRFADGSQYETPKLPYPADALEPYIAEDTVKVHHDEVLATHTDLLDKELRILKADRHPLAGRNLVYLLENLELLPKKVQDGVLYHGGGFINHVLFFLLSGGAQQSNGPSGVLRQAIEQRFGSVDAMKHQLVLAALQITGSGWAWLVLDELSDLQVVTTANEDTPLRHRRIPILGIDLWEHAYFLQYRTGREEYINAWLRVVDWDMVGALYSAAAGAVDPALPKPSQ